MPSSRCWRATGRRQSKTLCRRYPPHERHTNRKEPLPKVRLQAGDEAVVPPNLRDRPQEGGNLEPFVRELVEHITNERGGLDRTVFDVHGRDPLSDHLHCCSDEESLRVIEACFRTSVFTGGHQPENRHPDDRAERVLAGHPQNDPAGHDAQGDVGKQPPQQIPLRVVSIPEHGEDVADQQHGQDRADGQLGVVREGLGHQEDRGIETPGSPVFEKPTSSAEIPPSK